MENEVSDMERIINLQLNKFNNVQGLMRFINPESLYKMHDKQKGNKATGIDKIAKEEYGYAIAF